jgi:putative ABC transport system permease protein
MSAYRQKVIRDFWQERTRTVFVALAIAIGISAFSAVLSSYAILTRELDQGYLETNPASATLRTDKLDDELVAAIAASKGVSDAEARRTLTGRMKVGPVEWRNLTLFVVKDFGDIRVSTLAPQHGAWPPAPGEILIERDAVQVAKARIGDPVTIKTARGNELTLRFSGTVKDVGQAQARMENAVYGYINLDTLAQLGEEPYLDQLKIVVAGARFDEAHVRTVTADVQRLIESRGHQVRRVDIPEPGKHPHSNVMGLLLLAMSSFGLFALLLSGILVVNLLTALMAAQIRQIGVMKTLGGTRRQIAGIYFGQALLLGVAAFFLAIPVGLWGSRALCRYFAVLLNFDITSFVVPLCVCLLVAAVGLVIPLLAAAYPVWKGSGVSVREALDDYGVGLKAFGTSAFDRALTGLGGASRPVLLALRNSFRSNMQPQEKNNMQPQEKNNMRVSASVILVVIALMAVVSSASSTAPRQAKPKADAISGEWDAALTSPDNTLQITLKLKLEGDRVTGASESSHLGNGTINGSWANNTLRITVETSHAPLALTGTLQNGKLVGEWDAGHMQGKWEAKKKHRERSY